MVSNVVKIYDTKQKKEISYYLEPRLKRNLDKKVIPSLHEKDKDCFLVVDAAEGSGKSTLALQIGKYVDPTLNLSRVVFDSESFREAIFKAKKGQCVIFDEAFTGLSSRASLSAMNRTLISLLMQMRQKNLFVIMVLPTFFLLDKYVALFRTRALIHVYENRGIRGYFRIYNKSLKKLLYLSGKQTYSYGSKNSKNNVNTRFKGRFYGVFALGEDIEEKYRENKIKALETTAKNPMTAGQIKYREQRDLCLYLLRRNSKMTYEQLANLIGDYDFDITYVQISRICAKFGDKEAKSILKEPKPKEKATKTEESLENEQHIEDIDELDGESDEDTSNLD